MLIPLLEWARARYNPPPSMWVLRKWVRHGEIYPPPELVGTKYYVEESARRQSGHVSLVERIKEAA